MSKNGVNQLIVHAGHLEMHDVVHDYIRAGSSTRQRALDGVSLNIAPGEFVCLLGTSGCGKSTLLMILAGLVRPTSGTVLLDGQPVVGPSRERGVVFQEYALLPWKTVLGNVALGPRLRGCSRGESKAAAEGYLKLVGLGEFGHKYPHELSGGMSQRAAVARTLAAEPKVLLMDEPFAAVDAQTRRVLQEELVRIWQQNTRTVVFVTHSVEEATLLADRVVVLSSPGRVKEIIDVPIPRSHRFEASAAADTAAVTSTLLRSLQGQHRADRAGAG